ncbi:MAG TPA: LamG-like jellyroll fold domain-containing protein [Terriglobales bacterium]
MRMGAVAGSFTASPARTDFFLIGKSTALQIGAAAPTLFAQVNVCAGCYPNDTGSYSLTARRDFLAADPDNTNNSAIASAQIVAATTVAVTISPTAVTILAGSTQRFTAAVSNASDTTVTWSVNGIVGGDATVGTIDASGLYSAPASSGIVNINATSVADPSKSASAAVFLIFASTPALVADYQFANVYTSSVGEDPALVDIGSGTNAFATDSVRGASQTVLVFPTGNGLQLSPTTGLFANAVYTVAALVRLDTISGYRRILDFKNATSDDGLYNLNGNLVFYPVASGSSAPIAAGAYAQVVLTRAADGTVTGYVNGVQQFSFADTSSLAVIDGANVLRFFKDDNAVQNENSSGAVARIRIWDGALTAAQVAALESAPTADLSVSVVPAGGSAATITITNLGPASASNVVLTDTLDRFGFGSATPSQGGPCTFAASVVTCPLGAVAAGASATVTMVVTAPSQGWAAQTLKAISDALDPNPANNAARVGPALSSFNTPAGANVVVTATDSSGDAATVSFASVTRVGSTTISASAATTAAPAGFRFGTPAVIYDISSNADFAAPITVALRFNPASFHHPAKVRLFHLENGFWVDRTTGVNLAAATVSAVTSTLSPFVVVEPLNNPPVANAGAAQALAGLSATGASVKLDATSSSDADGDALTYRWTGAFPEGNGVVTGATPTVTVPLGASTVNLIVNDGENDSAPAAVSVTVADFMVAANSAAVSVKRGQSTTMTVAVSPKFAAYGDTVALSCPNLPAGVTCSFSPAAITPGANGASATLTITTTASVAQISGPGSARRAPPLFAFWFATLAPFGLVWTAGLRRRRTAVTLALMLLLLIVLVACGGGGITNNASSQPPTPSSTVTITITGTSSGLQHSTTVPLTLQ